jgi:hypothetical protein
MIERYWSSDRAIGFVACVLVLAFASNTGAATSGNEITINSPTSGTVVMGASVLFSRCPANLSRPTWRDFQRQ